MRNRLKNYLKSVKEIQALEEIQKSYSHTKAKKMFSYQKLKKCFKFFVAEDGDEFLSNFTGTKYDCYKQALDDLVSWHER